MKNWVETEFPGISERTKAENAEIFFNISSGVEKHKGKIERFFLPPYAPEYNPDELLNSHFKRGLSKRPSSRSDAELQHNVRSHLKTVQLRPQKSKGFFGSKTTSYAA